MNCSTSFERVSFEDIQNFRDRPAGKVLSDLKTNPTSNPFNIQFREVKIEKTFGQTTTSASFKTMNPQTFQATLDCMNRSNSSFQFDMCKQLHDYPSICLVMNKLTS